MNPKLEKTSVGDLRFCPRCHFGMVPPGGYYRCPNCFGPRIEEFYAVGSPEHIEALASDDWRGRLNAFSPPPLKPEKKGRS